MSKTETATLAGGCFWCTETIFKQLKGVTSVTPGYAGGKETDVSYEDVSSGDSGHAEAIQIVFDPDVISYETLLDVYWHTHNPTELNRQGADVGTQYRSEIFYHSEAQKLAARKTREALKNAKIYKKRIVTEITPYTTFVPAEEYHHDYYKKNPNSLYCTFVIDPKLKKFKERYKDLIK